MDEHTILDKAERIRDVLRYVKLFKNATVVIYLDDEILASPLFSSHIRDICLIHESGMRVIVVPGARRRINEVLSLGGIRWDYRDGYRITGEDAMPLIKMAAFDVSNQVMTAFAAEKKTAVIGNWVRSRGKGIIGGFDYATAGEIDRLQIDAIRTVLDDGFIPIFPCIGWSIAGKPYNISSVELAQQIAIHLNADKLVFLIPGGRVSTGQFVIPPQVGVSEMGTVPALNVEECAEFIRLNAPTGKKTTEHSVVCDDKIVSRETISAQDRDAPWKARCIQILRLATEACANGVSRVHLLDNTLNGTIPCEVFSDLGSGTMVYASNYGGIRNMRGDDIPAVLNVMQPFVQRGILLPRTYQQLQAQCEHFIVYEIDNAIRACASLIPYPSGQMEIAGIAVDATCSHMGIGPKLVSFLLDRAQKCGCEEVFLLTTQTADWFESIGFVQSDVSLLPPERRALWNPERNSKVFHKVLTA